MPFQQLFELVWPVGRLVVISTALLIYLLPSASASERVALVIGNSAYQSIQDLHNPRNDAADVAEKLKALDFQLFEDKVHNNLNERALIETYSRFVNAAYKKEIALLFYAGHGMQFDGVPHLLPVDVPNASVDVIQSQAISLNQIIGKLDDQADLSVAIFDACRNIPDFEQQIAAVTRGGSQRGWRGLSPPDVRTASTIIAYSGAAGEVVADGLGRNSPYTEILLSRLDKTYLQSRALDIPGVLNQVAYDFKQNNPGMQSPELLSSGIPPGVYYFAPAQDQQVNPQSPEQPEMNAEPPIVANPQPFPDLSEQTDRQPLELPKEQPSDQAAREPGFCSRNRVLCIGGAVLAAGAVAAAINNDGTTSVETERDVRITVPLR